MYCVMHPVINHVLTLRLELRSDFTESHTAQGRVFICALLHDKDWFWPDNLSMILPSVFCFYLIVVQRFYYIPFNPFVYTTVGYTVP